MENKLFKYAKQQTDTFLYLLSFHFFGSFVFKIKNIESIEKQKRHYSDIPEKSLIMRKFDLCTPQNINELAIPFSYIMSKYGNKFYFNNFVPYNVEHDFFREHLTHHFHMLLIKQNYHITLTIVLFGLNTNLALLKVKEIKITWIIIEKNQSAIKIMAKKIPIGWREKFKIFQETL